ncbi:MAG: CubicO group peptidase (beta-lactamase class C family) [Gammaproteobacteria bacterium]|jgi:CubicO group peptidase (beta-lactamase class C family)
MLSRNARHILVLLLGFLTCGFSIADESSEPLEPTDILFWSQAEKEKGFRNIDKILPTRKIIAGKNVLALPLALQDLSSVKYSIEGQKFSLEEHMQSQHVGGLLVLRKGQIVYENYELDNNEDSRWIAFSVAKSVTSMLIGAAIQDGYINSVEDAVTDYLPRLKGSAYDGASIKNVLNMASGVDWNEDYADPKSDVSVAAGSNAMELFQHLNTLNVSSKPGEVFNYSTGDTNLLGAVLRAAIGNNESAYLEQKIWKPFGMQSDASWIVDARYGVELGGCCLNATLRDYARIGLFALKAGVLADGTKILPDGWMKASTTPSKGYQGYGYSWWLRPDGSYAAQGIFGQLIWIDPKTETVIVTHSAWQKATSESQTVHRWGMVNAIAKALEQTASVNGGK